jgi:PqqD family protein of HPr-rel-A system
VARFRAAPADSLAVLELDGLVAVHHRASGQTHLLAEPAPEILAVLAGQALTADALLARLASDYALADADLVLLALRLEELVATGLVERL